MGNLISDFVKGKKQFLFSTEIQKGIQLHRKIDSFTDNHFATKQAKQFFKQAVGLYAGAFVDVVYDYFLANDKNEFADRNQLQQLAQNTYKILDDNFAILPQQMQQMLPYMKQQNWLYNYQFNWGIENSFKGIARRANYLQANNKAFDVFIENYGALSNCYNLFFKDVKKMVLTETNS